jgi:tetratricopeptide (TPR) repeat protein
MANARVAYVRLAELTLMTEETDKALEMLKLVNRIFPNHKSYLRKLALAYTETKQFKNAIEIWRKLATGLDPGSDLWFEAKFQLASNLYRVGDRSGARQVYDQTILLSNKIPKNWQLEFDQLSELLLIE